MTASSRRGALLVALSVLIAVAFIGFARGIGDAPPEPAPLRDLPVPGATAPARGYLEMRAPRAAPKPLSAVGEAPADGTRGEALVARAALRAYDGAPPTVPHPVRQDSAAECLACHADGLVVRGRVASRMSHPPYASCTQCHVVNSGPMPGGDALPPGPPFADNAFTGLPAPVEGPRWTPIAPPQIPHRTFMREECTSCHGPLGRAPLRTTHPERQSCTQCHAEALPGSAGAGTER